MKSLIYDFETLGQNPNNSAVTLLSALVFDEDRFESDNPYTWEELEINTRTIKFDVKDQVQNYSRKINMDTVNWWNSLPEDTKKLIEPRPDDKPLVALYDFMFDIAHQNDIKKVYTRGNTFDPMFMTSLFIDINKQELFPFWTIRDTRSMIEGLSYGSNLRNDFVPEEYKDIFVKHNPIHDVVLDVIRMQTLVRAIS